MNRPLLTAMGFVLTLAWVPAVKAQRTAPPPNDAVRTYVVSGALRFADSGRPAEMVKVDLRRFTGETIGTAFTRSNGDFEFQGVFRGTYYLMAEEEGYEPIRELVEVLNTDRRGVVIYLNRPVQIIRNDVGDVISARELSLPKKAREAFEKGRERLLEKHDPQGSLAHLNRATKELPDYYEAFHLLGVAYAHLGRMEDSETAYQQSIELSKSKFAPALVSLAAMLCDQRRFAEAERFAREGVKVDPQGWLGHYHLARSLVGLSQLGEAEEHLDEAAKRNKEYADIHLVYANIFMRTKNDAGLLKHLEEYLRLSPDGPAVGAVRKMRDDLRSRAAAQPSTVPTKP